MSAKLWAGLFCLAVGLSIGEEAIAQDAESAKSQTTSKTEISRPIVDLVAQAEQAQGGKESSSSSKTKTESSSTSLSLSTTSIVTSTSASSGATGGAAPRQPILPYNGTFDTSIPIKVPGFHGIEPKIAFHYNSAQGIRDFARPGGELGIGWNISGLSVIEAASTGRGVPKFDGTDSYLRDGWEIITCTSSMTSPSCTSGGTHVMRVESYERLKYDSSANTWEVTEKDGTKLLYKPLGDGQSYDTGNSTTVSLATKYRWLLRSVTDTHGNAVNRSDPNGHTFGSRSGDWGGNSNAHTNFNGGSNGCSCHGSSKSSGTAYLGNMPMKQSDKGVAELAFDRTMKSLGVSQTYGRVSGFTGGGAFGGSITRSISMSWPGSQTIAHALKASATWSTWSFVSHYYFGKGVAVNLSDIGLASLFENARSVKIATESFIRGVLSRAYPGYSYSKRTITNVTLEPSLFSIGDSTFYRNATCGGSTCNFNFAIDDDFKEPLDIKGVEPGGTPYAITHSWSEVRPY